MLLIKLWTQAQSPSDYESITENDSRAAKWGLGQETLLSWDTWQRNRKWLYRCRGISQAHDQYTAGIFMCINKNSCEGEGRICSVIFSAIAGLTFVKRELSLGIDSELY